mgnify:FL=1|jgi:hypothetical protein|tara:strand:+ start:218 stop:403 length:186 start_codon:yes stop_codon:yes gene_type:complete
MVDQKDLRIGCTKKEMKSRIENYLPYLDDDDLKDISVQLYNIHKRRQEVQRKNEMELKENG